MADIIRRDPNLTPPKTTPGRRGGLWIARVIIYIGTFFLCFQLLAPKVHEWLFWLSSIPVAALAIGLEIFLSSRVEHRTMEETVGSRILIIDHWLAGDQSLANQQLAAKEQAAMRQAERAQISDANGFDLDQNYWRPDSETSVEQPIDVPADEH